MKTLDEVIKALDACLCGAHDRCPYCGDPDVYKCDEAMQCDAYQYLKKLKRIEAKIEKIALGNITETLEKLDNPPLMWDELKQMEGKPVWVEYMDDKQQTGWALIVKNPERPIFGKPKLFTFVGEEGKFYLTISGYGKRWQAYRKERI